MSKDRKPANLPRSNANYSYYASARRTGTTIEPRRDAKRIQSRMIAFLVVAVLMAGVFVVHSESKAGPTVAAKTTTSSAKPVEKTATSSPKAKAAAVQPIAEENHCKDNELDHFIVVSISARHLWACEGKSQKYDSPVITGMEQHAATLTPHGTYKIYGKVRDTVLTGSDETGSWKDPVSYWMPWLDNEYGTYGFHDATWRDNNAFGKVDPNSNDASHGCVELPLATAAWIYDWSSVGTTLIIQA